MSNQISEKKLQIQSENNQKKKRTVGEYLFKDKRKYKKRLQLAIFPCTAFFFTFLFFGPLEIYLTNASDLSYSLASVLPVFILPFILLSAVSTLLISFIKGRTFNFVLGLVLSLTVAGYIQCNLMNGSYSDKMTGDIPDWTEFISVNIITIAVWIAILVLISYLLIRFRRHYYRYITLYISIFLIAIQLIGGVSMIIGYKPNDQKIALLKTGEFEYSTKKNTIVFLLDRFDYDYVEKVLEDDPKFFDDLDGFTSYTNCISIYARTKPGANGLLTAASNGTYLKPVNKFYDDSWTEKAGKSILSAIKEQGYSEAIYGEYSDFFSDRSKAADLDNTAIRATKKINSSLLFRRLTKASAYRYLPGFLKPFFWYSTDDLINVVALGDTYSLDDPEFFSDLKSDFSVENKNPTFKFYHLNGPHAPYILDENGEESLIRTNVVKQTKGVFTILRTLFDKMKEAGIYDSTEIIITADHGNAVDDRQPLKKATCIALFHKPAGASGSLKYSNAPVSHENIPATILKSTGYTSYKDFGIPLDETSESDNTVRYYYKTAYKLGTNIEGTVYKYKVIGDAKDFNNWEMIDEYEITAPFYK